MNEDNYSALPRCETRLLRIAASLLDGQPLDLSRNIPGLDRERIRLVRAAIANANANANGNGNGNGSTPLNGRGRTSVTLGGTGSLIAMSEGTPAEQPACSTLPGPGGSRDQ